MDCEKNQEAVSLMIDGELPSVRQGELFRHLAACEECRTFLDGALRIRDAGMKDQPGFPREIDEELLARIPEARSRKAVRRRPFQLSRSLAAAVAIVLLAVGYFAGKSAAPAASTVTQTSAMSARASHPATVIMVYGIPPVDVVGTAPAAQKQLVY